MAYTALEGETIMTSGVDAGTLALLGNQKDGIGMGGGLIGGVLLGSLLSGGNGIFGGRNDGAAAAAVASDIVLNPAFQSLQSQIQTLAAQTSQNQIASEINELESAVNAGLLSTLSGIKDNSNLYLQGQAALQTAQAAGNFTTLNSINGLGNQVTAQSNQNALQQLNSFNQLNTTTLQSFNEASRDNANAFNQVQMSLNAMAAANAACCCELKSAVFQDGSSTRALIEALNVQNLQAQLADAKGQASNLAQSIAFNNSQQAQTNVILQHLVPFVSSSSTSHIS